MARINRWPALALVVAVAAACSSGSADSATSSEASSTDRAPVTIALAPQIATSAPPPTTPAPAPTRPPTSAPAMRRPTTTSTTTSTTSTTSTTAVLPPDVIESRLLGFSVEGRPITAIRRGSPGGLPVLVVGVIHGNEDAGVAVIQDLMELPVPDGVDLWLIESMNPDGQLAGRRTNANLVDLNRNFPEGWAPLGQPGDGQYAGTGPASEPETQAVAALIREIQPMLVIWYHQDLYRIAPAKGRAGEIRKRYADLTGLPIVPIKGGTYTGTAAGWARSALPEGGVAFIVELGPTLSAGDATTHANAVLTLAAEF